MKRTILLTVTLFFCGISFSQNVGIGTPTPQSDLHLHSPTTSSSTLRLSNNITTDASNRGTTMRMLGGNFFLQNFETNGSIQMAANGFPGATITKGSGNYNIFGLGTTSPKLDLHLHNPINRDVSMILTNSLTTDGPGRGGRIRMVDSDFIIGNNEASGHIELITDFQTRMTIKNTGNIGINTINPQTWLHVNGDAINNEAIRVTGSTPYQSFYDGASFKGFVQAASDGFAIGAKSNMPLTLYTGDKVRVNILDDGRMGIGTSTPVTKLHLVDSIDIADMLLQTPNTSPEQFAQMRLSAGDNDFNELRVTKFKPGASGTSYGMPRDNLSTISAGPSGSKLVIDGESLIFATGTASEKMRIEPNGYVGIGTVAPNAKLSIRGTENTNPLVLLTQFGTSAPALKIAASSGSNGGMELENTAIKVSGTNKPVFQHEATAGNTTLNQTVLPNTGFANSATDMLIVTPLYDNANIYVNVPIGVFFSNGSWRIFTQDISPLPIGAKFNVLVVKQ